MVEPHRAPTGGAASVNGRNEPPLRVLIVDDNPLDRADAKAALTRGSARRYEFTEATSAEEALHGCAHAPLPDCIVLDLGLPDADEFDVLKRLPRDADNLLRVPVVVLTASVELGLSQAALRAGAQDYVGKAWLLPETLTQAVDNAIERLRMARALEVQRRMAETSRRQVQQLESESRQIQEANRLKSLFLANMSHELRTPLAAVIGFADLLMAGQVPAYSPKHQAFLGHIGTSGRHLLRLINDVLDLSKVESGKFEFFPEVFDLGVLVKGIRDVMDTEFQRKRIHVAVDIDANLGPLKLDTSRLRQVLYNYLSNALKFTPAGGLITVRASAVGARHFRLEVEDSGVGIAAADLPRLFTAYQQLDAGSAKRYEGTGLGLALTRRLVMAQGGQVGVRSVVGEGSVFHLLLNRIDGTDAARDAEAGERLATAADSRMLLIHDGRDDPHPLVPGLQAAGFQVDAAGSGEQAVQRANSRAYDAIALDLMLTDQHGLSVLHQIRHASRSCESPVVGIRMRGDAGVSATFAIADVLCKPIRTDEVGAAMARFQRPGTSPTNVMVIDDDPAELATMRTTLKAIGIDATCLRDGRQALGELQRHRPDAIILGLVMAGFDGFAVLDGLQQLPDWRDTPVFIWTRLLLSDADYTSLGKTARAIAGQRGGSLDATLVALRNWRPAATSAQAASPR